MRTRLAPPESQLHSALGKRGGKGRHGRDKILFKREFKDVVKRRQEMEQKSLRHLANEPEISATYLSQVKKCNIIIMAEALHAPVV